MEGPTRTKNWLFTSYEEHESKFDGANMDYIIQQRERCPETGRLHWQGYVEFKNAVRMSRAKHHLGGNRIHVEARRGTQQQAIKYCSKSDTQEAPPTTFGQPHSNAQGQRNDLEELKQDAIAPIAEYDVALTRRSYARHIRFFRRLRYMHGRRQAAINGFNARTVVWYHGAPGLGKSRRAMYEACRAAGGVVHDVYRKPSDSKWWDGYEGQKFVIIDDIDGNGGISVGTWKRLLDGYPEQVEVKGGFVPWRAVQIWITSNYSVNDWFQQISTRIIDHVALRRRITEEVHFTGEWVPPHDSEPSDSDESIDMRQLGEDEEEEEEQ